MAKRTVEVVFLVEVETDDSKFTEEWMETYRQLFNPLFDVGDHAENIAQLEAREMLDPEFTEGYGPLADMGIKAKIIGGGETVIEVDPAGRVS